MKKIIAVLLMIATLISCTTFAECAHEHRYYDFPSGNYYYNWRVKMLIVDEICADCGKKTRYSVRLDIASYECLGSAGMAHCKMKMTFTDGTERIYYCHHYCPKDDGVCEFCGGWYCRNYETAIDKAFVDNPSTGYVETANGIEIVPVYAENKNTVIEGIFTATEFCNIMPYSEKVLGITTDTVFHQMKYWGTDQYGNATYELIADNGGVAFAHVENITEG